MARKPSDIVQPNLRIREDLRRKLDQAAKQRGMSLNQEMTARLNASFDRENLFTLGGISEDIKINWARFGNAWHELDKQGDLLRAAEALVAQIEKLPSDIREREPIKKAVAQVQKAIRLIETEAAQMIRRMSTGGK